VLTLEQYEEFVEYVDKDGGAAFGGGMGYTKKDIALLWRRSKREQA